MNWITKTGFRDFRALKIYTRHVPNLPIKKSKSKKEIKFFYDHCVTMVGSGGRIAKTVDVKDGGPPFVNKPHTYIVLSLTSSVLTPSPYPHCQQKKERVEQKKEHVKKPAKSEECRDLYNCTVTSLSLSLRSFGFLRSPTPTGLVPAICATI